MLQLNWFRTAWRNIRHQPLFTFINLAGLTTGFAGAMLIACLLHYHLSFDNFHKDKERIYRVVSKTTFGGDDYSQGLPQPFGKAFAADYTFAENVAMRADWGEPQVTVGNGEVRKMFHSAAAYVEPAYFNIFNYPLVSGTVDALQAPYQALITEKEARRFFSGTDVIGKQILLNNKYQYTIVGVMKDIPENSSNQQQIYLSYASYKIANPWLGSDSSWGGISSSIQCFMKLRPGVTATTVEGAFPQLLKKVGHKEMILYMQPLSDIHFNRIYDGQIEKKQLWGLSLVGLFLVLMAGINFINLTTARLFYRSREAGVRKVLGSSATMIRWQFIMETGILVLAAILLSVAVTYAAFPSFNQLFDTKISPRNLYQPWFLGFAISLFVVVTLLVGYYPGSLLARLKPVETMRGKVLGGQTAGIPLRKVLVVAQFAIVLFLISCTLIISKQLRSSMDTDIGFNKSGILMINIPEENKRSVDLLRNRFSEMSGVKAVSFCLTSPMSVVNNEDDFVYDGRPKTESFRMSTKTADANYLATFGLQLIAGRNLYGGDTLNGCLVNETFVKRVKAASPEAVIGKTIGVYDVKATILGVVKDFHTGDFHGEIDPLCLYSDFQGYYSCAVKMNVRDAKTLLPALEKVWKDTYPDYTWSYQFLDENISRMYHAEEVLLGMIRIFSSLAVLVGCIGLLGLVSFMAIQRRKEIGIRKVLGASVSSILWLFLKEFIVLIFFSLIIAIPVAWYVMHEWLQDFAYRLTIGPEAFAWPVVITVVMVVTTIGVKSVRAALANPVSNLRSE
ncbi:ABC transporter permease [Chitinophaga arvensicola]|uniref:ABC-type antimicrobial peptide transport system, permease component n=1 Tax=Chitinophaga arvensicola TaxID=29529 RepID=A0A1I0SBT7_9BACT|nr:ABC transporter permease [Chitinophaga arvensicola]SEW54264.1 ABC-type antimicrobial peptide transport system, permease component [Chitinophaga arvensicola]